MGSKPIIVLIAVIGSALILSAGGCSNTSGQAQIVTTRSEKLAPSDYNPDTKSDSKDGSKFGADPNAHPNKEETNSIIDKAGDGVDLPEREEIRRSYTIKPGADVIVSGPRGRVDVETAEIDHAEVLVVRSARSHEDLQYRKVKIDHDPSELRISFENERRSIFSTLGPGPETQQRVTLKLPRKVKLEINGVKGDVGVGEIEGGADFRMINGRIVVAQAIGGASFRAVSGKIDLTIARLTTGGGVELNGINGNATLRFIGDLNADIEADGFNGRVDSELPNLKESKDEKRHGHYSARIGTGGPQIEIRSFNGNISLARAEKPNPSSKVAVK